MTVVLGVALIGIAAWEGTLGRQTTAAHWSVGTLAVVAIAAAAALGRHRQLQTSHEWLSGSIRSAARWRRHPAFGAGVAVWVLLILAVIGWDLNSFVHQSHDLPTLSYYIGRLTRWEWGRALLFAAWLAGGVGLVTGHLERR